MNVISGMMAADGEACKTMNTGRPNHSALGERPMTMPASTPPRPVSSTPTTSGRIVSLYASRNVPSASMSPTVAIVSLKLGNAGLIATRPAHSQRARTRRTERTRRVRGSVTALTTRTGTLPNERRFAGRYGLVLRRRWGGRPQGGARQLPRVAGDQATSPGPRRADARGGGVPAAAQRGVPAARGARGVPFGRHRERLPGRLEGRRLRQGGREQPRRCDGDRLQPRVRGSEANRELVAWMRDYNRRRDSDDRLRFYGFDAPIEMMGVASPRRALAVLHAYLASHLEAALLPCTPEAIDRLVGDDGRWTDPAAAMDSSRSVGASREAGELRLLTDDLVALLTSESPRLIAATSHDQWRRACLHGRTAAGLLRYHAKMADTSGSRAAQLSQLLGQRDALMNANLRDIVAQEARRGPTLVFAHNRHLQKHRSVWLLPTGWGASEGEVLSWWGAGAIAAAQMGDRYAFLVSALGSAADQGLDAPEPDTLEGALSTIAESRCIFNSRHLAETLSSMGAKLTLRTDASTNHGYFALDRDQLDRTDGVIFIKDIPSSSHWIRMGDASDANPQEC